MDGHKTDTLITQIGYDRLSNSDSFSITRLFLFQPEGRFDPEYMPHISGNPWSTYMADIYAGRKGPQPLGTVIFEEIEEKAREKLKDQPDAFWFAAGNAGAGKTYDANVKAFDQWAIIPRMLVDASNRDLGTTIFGVRHKSPIILAPIGLQAIFAEEAEFNPARAAHALGVPLILSSSSTRPLEEVAQANSDGHRWFQLYRPQSDEVTLSILSRAKACNYSTLVVTVDTMILGWRPRDLATSYFPLIHAYGSQLGLSDPVFMQRYGRKPLVGPETHPKFPYDSSKMDRLVETDANVRDISNLGMEWSREFQGLFRSWKDLKFLRDNWEGPLVLKGIQHAEDALLAIEHGVDGIVVSNHGGRQVDAGIPSLVALNSIMRSPGVKNAVRSGKFTVLFDSGIRTGTDIFKAIALGAHGVLLGRPWLYGMIVAGQVGIEQVIKHTLADLDNTLGLSGYSTLDEIRGRYQQVLQHVEGRAKL